MMGRLKGVRSLAVMAVFFALLCVMPAQASEPGWMGVYLQESGRSAAQAQNLPRFDHALVTRTVDGAPAGPAGIRAGDIIVAVNGETVSQQRFLEKIASHSPGDTVTVEISRDGLRGEIDVTLTSRAAWQQAQSPNQASRSPRNNVQWRGGSFLVGLDIVGIPCDGCTVDPSPMGLAFGGTFYINEILAVSGAVGIGIIESEASLGLGDDVDIGLAPYVRGNLKIGHFSNPEWAVYGLVGIEPFTLTVDGSSADDTVGGIAFGIGGTLGNGRVRGDSVGIEMVFVQDSDLDGDILRLSAFWEF